jgi:hypothetical protein
MVLSRHSGARAQAREPGIMTTILAILHASATSKEL